MPNRVRASILRGQKDVVTKDFPFPEVTDDSLIVKVEMCGVCGTDVHVYNGYSFTIPLNLPISWGHETVGRVYAIGERAAKEMEFRGAPLREGDRVVWHGIIPCRKCHFCRNAPSEMQLCQNSFQYGYVNCERPENKPWIFGGYGEYVFIKPNTSLWKVDEKIPLEAVAMIDTLASVRGIEKAMMPYPNMKAGFGFMDTVVVLGDGPVGICAVAKAKALGAGKVILVGHHEHRLKLAKEFGMDDSLGPEYKNGPEGFEKHVRDLTDGVGADAVINTTGVPESFLQGLRLTRRGGTYVEIGNSTDRGTVTIRPSVDICLADRTIIGQLYCAPQQYNRDPKLIESMRFPFQKLVSDKFKLAEVHDAMDSISKREAIKAAIVP